MIQIFSSYGCYENTTLPRTFWENNYLFSDRMADVFSGGVVYQYSDDVSLARRRCPRGRCSVQASAIGSGLVNISTTGCAGSPWPPCVYPKPDFENLRLALAQYKVNGTMMKWALRARSLGGSLLTLFCPCQPFRPSGTSAEHVPRSVRHLEDEQHAA
jgi:hypothetical protein